MPIDLTAIHGTAWTCEPAGLRRAIASIARVPTCPSGRELVAERIRRMDVARQASARAIGGVGRGQKIGVIPIYGPVEQRLTAALDKAGGTSLEEVSAMFDVLVNDPSVGSIVLHIDSPGGSSYGTQELSDAIYSARRQKPIYCIADSMCCSASYWIGTAANEVYVTPGGDVGSVGVYCVHVDESQALEEDGIKVTIVSAGEYKAELANVKPLTDSAKAYLQASVDETYQAFVSGVARNRGVSTATVLADYGQGRVLGASRALAAGLVDGIMTFDQLMSKLLGGGESGQRGARAASAEVLRLRHEQRRRLVGVA